MQITPDKYLGIISAIFLICCLQKEASGPLEDLTFPEISHEMKPWTRWWWHGSAVTPAGITAELETLKEVGIGGVEITPIYGVDGGEHQFVDFLTPEWVQLLEHTLTEAKRLGLGVDMATGTGWPFGGPWVDAEYACKLIRYQEFKLGEGEILDTVIQFVEEPLLRLVKSASIEVEHVMDPISANENLQKLAIDQIRFARKLPLISVMAYSSHGEVLDIISEVDTEGKLIWQAPAGQWKIMAVFRGWHGKLVERAAPGGEGNVIDHFSKSALTKYLSHFDSTLAQTDLSYLRSFFNDSYEVDDARGQANWTPNLFVEFEKRRGYDLKYHLPKLLTEDTTQIDSRILSDYRETMGELLLENFTHTWKEWAKQHGTIMRNQAHGSPANILDLYAASDIPETEGTDLIKAKMASSAAHVAGKRLVSAEAATWLGEHFNTNLADLKKNLDNYFLAGINHVVYHGTCYSPPDATWPGRLFYAAIHANSRNSLWPDYPQLNTYVSRCQSFLQSGVADNDLLLYLPAHDRYASKDGELLTHFDGWAAPRNGQSEVRHTAEWLDNKGYGYDFISDKQIQKLVGKDRLIENNSSFYQALVVPKAQFMPLETLRKLVALERQGAKIVWQNLPMTVPGYYNLASRQQEFDSLIMTIKGSGAIIDHNLEQALTAAEIQPEMMVDLGLSYHRRRDVQGKTYFILNESNRPVHDWIPLATSPESVALFDPMTGESGLGKMRQRDNQSEVFIQLDQGASIIIRSFTTNVSAKSWHYINPLADSMVLDGTWQLTFASGGPNLPERRTLDQLQLWTNFDDAQLQSFSGTAIYEMDFEHPGDQGSGWLLDLGVVHESASVSLNNESIATLIGPTFRSFIPSELLKEKNTVTIAVSNLMANRIRTLEQSGTRWQQFYNINMSAKDRENLARDGVFTAKHWDVRPSGLGGPVTLRAIE